MKFKEMNLPQYIMEGLKVQGFENPTDIQEKCIPLIMGGKDVIGKSETGSGKTYAYGIPAITSVKTDEKGVNVIVICPTRELASQVSDEIKKLLETRKNCKTALIVGGNSFDRQLISLKNKETKIVIGTPGRIMDHLNRRTLKLNDISMVVLDEADEMLNMGFKEDIETILKSTKTDHQTVMFSATMPKPILEITKNFMKDPEMVELSNENNTSKLIKQYYITVDNKREMIPNLIDTFDPYISMIFCNTKRTVDDVTKFLKGMGYSVAALHGDMRQRERRETMTSFKKGDTRILVATDVAARGIDVKDIELIINYDIPFDIEYYIHRIGRTGRAGKTGTAITLVNSKQQLKQIDVIRKMTNADLEEYKLEGVENVSLTGGDKRERTRRYFANKPEAQNRTGKTFGDKMRKATSSEHKSYRENGKGFKRTDSSDKKYGSSDKKYGSSDKKYGKTTEKKPKSSFDSRKPLAKKEYGVKDKRSGDFSKGEQVGKIKYPKTKESFKKFDSKENLSKFKGKKSYSNNNEEMANKSDKFNKFSRFEKSPKAGYSKKRGEQKKNEREDSSRSHSKFGMKDKTKKFFKRDSQGFSKLKKSNIKTKNK